MTRIAFALHGGAGAKAGRDYSREIAHMRVLALEARMRLKIGAPALEVALETVVALEDSGLYVAGRGASPNLDGQYELDASIMDGASRRAGAVAALQGFRNPVDVAYRVMTSTPHVFLVGAGAAKFAEAQGCAPIDDEQSWFTRAGQGESNHPPGALAHGTVGCVVRDLKGRLAAATSTAGVFGKMPGRVGDTPVIGAGTWADGAAAVSCTGQGEFFLRTQAAAQVAFRVGAGQTLEMATAAVLKDIQDLGGEGGMIAIDGEGRVLTPFASAGMKRAYFEADSDIVSEAF